MSAKTVAHISDICLLVADVARSVTFYHEVLGLAIKRLDTGFAEFWTHGAILALWQRDDIADNLSLPEARGGGTSVMLAVRMETAADVDREYERLSKAGLRFNGPPAEYAWNAYAAYFSDPDGHLWEIYSWRGEPRTLAESPTASLPPLQSPTSS
ncbi:MAG: VOC family protein [Roseibium sp.]|nr:VOC family protein [Roseibium sp.]